MASRFQATSLVASPSCPNAVAWSDENLVAVASGHLVTILNPAMPFGPRGLITIPASKPFPIGVVERKDLQAGCLLPTCLSRDVRPCVRSISWSPLGLAPNSGCLLAVCTTEGSVKLYRLPYCEFCAEWIEVLDISEMLCSYLSSISFRELEIPSSNDEQASQQIMECPDDLPISVFMRKSKRRRQSLAAVESKSDDMIEYNPYQIVCVPCSKGKPLKKIQENCSRPLITADQYASRSAMLASLLVAWSPILCLLPENGPVSPDNSSKGYSLLAVGGKSGKVSFWRIHEPQCYSVVSSKDPTSALLVGLLQAHTSWITAISWALLVSDASNPQILFTTGSSDGSVKIWLGHGRELLKSSEVSHTPFSLLREVITVNSVPVSVLSLQVPLGLPHKLYVAVGKGSGSFEVWICDISINKYDRVVSPEAHDHIITGLVWAFDGCCLYSCSQDFVLELNYIQDLTDFCKLVLSTDNSVRCWSLHGNSLSEVPIPSNIPGVKSSIDVPTVYDSCFGVAVSPGNMVLAVARSFDTDQLNPMYQARTQKAAVEFFWIGGQQLDAASNRDLEFDVEAFPGFLEKELNFWESNILWSLSLYEQLDKPLVVWDVVAALLAFKQSSPKYAERVIAKWLISYTGSQLGLSISKLLPRVSRSLSKITSRQLHLLNIMCRHVILGERKGDTTSNKQNNIEGLCGSEEELTLWTELLLSCERELRERLVGFSFSTVLSLISHSLTRFCKFGYWRPVGLAQMQQWVGLNPNCLRDDLKLLASEVGKLDKSILHSTCEYVAEEQCSYCSASVPFESVEAGLCRGIKCDGGDNRSHKLARCSVSMQVCPTNPLWFCSSCKRWASKLAPRTLFTMRGYPSDVKSSTSALEVSAKPLCPFCGILLHRLLPEFLLTPSPV